ncbi:MAG: hypothetical protein ACJ746_09265 [Bryobacteraceae bacterium]
MPKRSLIQVQACLLLSPVFGWAGACPSTAASAEIKDFWTGKPSVAELNKRVGDAIQVANAQIHSIAG